MGRRRVGGLGLAASQRRLFLWGGEPRNESIIQNHPHKTSTLSTSYLAIFAAVFGIGLTAGIIWVVKWDFVLEPTTNAAAGGYTIPLAVGISVNAFLAVKHARQKNFAKHKDHALMLLFWTLDPALNRAAQWLMRIFCVECWTRESTRGQSLSMAKLCANMFLMGWGLLVGLGAGRLNRVILWNVTGQFVLWCAVVRGLTTEFQGGGVALWLLAVSVVQASTLLWLHRKALFRDD